VFLTLHDKKVSGACKRKVKKATLLYHPDKFGGKFGAKLHPAEKESITERVAELSKALLELLSVFK
jgi:hypothetical protein